MVTEFPIFVPPIFKFHPFLPFSLLIRNSGIAFQDKQTEGNVERRRSAVVVGPEHSHTLDIYLRGFDFRRRDGRGGDAIVGEGLRGP